MHKKSWRADARLLAKEVLPQWGRRKASAISWRDVLALLDWLVERGAPIQANRVLALVRKLFNWAISRDVLAHNPCFQVKAPGKEAQRDRVLDDDEIRAVWDACEALQPLFSTYFKLRLLTAQRGGEVRTMRWEDVDLETGWWTIPARITKNGLAHRVPLSGPAHDILQALHTTAASPWIFPSPRRAQQPLATAWQATLQFVARSEVAFVSHDLRRTAASHMTSMGIPRLVVAKILNHVEMGVTRVYDRHSYDAEKRQALDAWGRKVITLVAGETGRVIPLQRKTGEYQQLQGLASRAKRHVLPCPALDNIGAVEELMLVCQYCRRPLTLRDPRFCPVCNYPPSRQELDEYGVYAILASLRPYVDTDQETKVLKGWLLFQREVGQIEINHAPTASPLD